jgi:hypothetical protein
MSRDDLPRVVIETADDNAGGFRALEIAGVHAAILSFAGEKTLGLDCQLRDADGELQRYVFELDRSIDPYEVAAELMGCSDVILRQTARDAGIDARGQAKIVRNANRLARRARRQHEQAISSHESAHCHFCQRSTAFVVDGVRLCKRHAEELGERPHGKIGEEACRRSRSRWARARAAASSGRSASAAGRRSPPAASSGRRRRPDRSSSGCNGARSAASSRSITCASRRAAGFSAAVTCRQGSRRRRIASRRSSGSAPSA